MIPRGTHIPTHFGLHHHGDEPEVKDSSLSVFVGARWLGHVAM